MFLLSGLTQAGGEAHEVGDLPRREVAKPQSAQPPQLLLVLPCRQLLQAFEHRVHLGDERRGEVNPTRATRCSGHFQDCCCFRTIDQGSFCDFAALETLDNKQAKVVEEAIVCVGCNVCYKLPLPRLRASERILFPLHSGRSCSQKRYSQSSTTREQQALTTPSPTTYISIY